MTNDCKPECRVCGGISVFTPAEALHEAVMAGFLSSRALRPGMVPVTHVPANILSTHENFGCVQWKEKVG